MRSHVQRTGHTPHVVVIGAGLAGLTAALDAADGGARVTLLERRRRLGGLTWSFEHDGRAIDNGQHVFLRCCDAYLGFLRRIGSAGDVALQPKLDITVLRSPGPDGRPRRGRLRRGTLPAPAHLAPTLAGYRHLGAADRLRVPLAALPLRSLDLTDPALDRETFGAWLARHGQRPGAVEALWDLITLPTVNLPAAEASAAMGAKVFQTGLLTDAAAADIGWSRIPLGTLHGERATRALAASGVEVHLGARARALAEEAAGWVVRTDAGDLEADAVIVAVPHTEAGGLLPPGSVAGQERLADLGTSAVVDVHVLYDRHVTDLPLFAGLGSIVQWVFDRTATSGLGRSGRGGQYLAVSVSGADDLVGRHPQQLADEVVAELARLLPAARPGRVTDTLVTKERTATFRASPGTAALRPPARTARPGLAVAGAWTDTGWPATMEGAVRSGHAAARCVLAGLASTTHHSVLPEEVA
ncbi:MAG TPA: hydroxysqualene dehydroxylase HpnE [Acidimicrobiales bacterium]|nr:hydroxysqualene dehydroxylase HpnE [Acidimicrobiales bacterium]